MPHPYPELARTVLLHPAIDNHAHPLLTEANRDAFPFEGLVSEASGKAADDIGNTLIFHHATARLAELYGLPPYAHASSPESIAATSGDEIPPEIVPGTVSGSTWDALKKYRADIPYEELNARVMKACHLETLLLDDGLAGVETLCMAREAHDSFTRSSCKRIVRVEAVAQDILAGLFVDLSSLDMQDVTLDPFCETWLSRTYADLQSAGSDEAVVGFKSVVAYRTGLDVVPLSPIWRDWIKTALAPKRSAEKTVGLPEADEYLVPALRAWMKAQRANVMEAKSGGGQASFRIQDKAVNDLLVGIAMIISELFSKPVQFHTGLGDSDLRLARASPAHLQPLLDAHPNTRVVLLHGSYPYTRDAGILAALYPNVYLDFGEVFAFISAEGQRAVIREMLEMAPWSKIMWSTDGHWWPESFYLGSLLAREALLDVLTSSIRSSRLPVPAAIELAKNALFHTANKAYNLGLATPEGF
ncbi:hypothetical protein PENSPDRAFT_688983 [Peniophora sp. CONT]|nr:hypothetical protein PENSPDRAFT_688983 [Peniophora sp. CONT]